MRLFFLVTVVGHWLMTKEKLSGLMKLQSPVLEWAIPSNLAKQISAELAEKGYIERSWMGLECQPFLKGSQSGILVSGVIENFPAQIAEFLPGDILTHLNGKKVEAKIPEDLPPFHQTISALPPGTKLILTAIGKINPYPGR